MSQSRLAVVMKFRISPINLIVILASLVYVAVTRLWPYATCYVLSLLTSITIVLFSEHCKDFRYLLLLHEVQTLG